MENAWTVKGGFFGKTEELPPESNNQYVIVD